MNLCMGSGTLPEICEHSSPCHPHIQVTALPCKEEAICESSRKIAVFSWPSSFKMERGNVEKMFCIGALVPVIKLAHLERHHQC